MIRLYLRHQWYDMTHWATKTPKFLSLIQFLLDHGANPNTICSHNASCYGASQGTALDLFAGELSGHAPLLVFDEEIGNSLLEKLANEGAEFSKPLRTGARFHTTHLSRHFQAEIEELRLFPEQIEGKIFILIVGRFFRPD